MRKNCVGYLSDCSFGDMKNSYHVRGRNIRLDKINIIFCTKILFKIRTGSSCKSIAYCYPAVQEIVHLPLLLPWRLEGKSISSAVFVILPSSCFCSFFFPPPPTFSFFYPNFFGLCSRLLMFYAGSLIRPHELTPQPPPT